MAGPDRVPIELRPISCSIKKIGNYDSPNRVPIGSRLILFIGTYSGLCLGPKQTWFSGPKRGPEQGPKRKKLQSWPNFMVPCLVWNSIKIHVFFVPYHAFDRSTWKPEPLLPSFSWLVLLRRTLWPMELKIGTTCRPSPSATLETKWVWAQLPMGPLKRKTRSGLWFWWITILATKMWEG